MMTIYQGKINKSFKYLYMEQMGTTFFILFKSVEVHKFNKFLVNNNSTYHSIVNFVMWFKNISNNGWTKHFSKGLKKTNMTMKHTNENYLCDRLRKLKAMINFKGPQQPCWTFSSWREMNLYFAWIDLFLDTHFDDVIFAIFIGRI